MLFSLASWLKKLFSADPEASSSRVIQFLVSAGVLALMWLAIIRSWAISDNARVILVTLVMGAFGAYAFSKAKEGA